MILADLRLLNLIFSFMISLFYESYYCSIGFCRQSLWELWAASLSHFQGHRIPRRHPRSRQTFTNKSCACKNWQKNEITPRTSKRIKPSAWPKWGQDANIGPSHIWKHLVLFRESKAPTHLEKTASNTELSYWKLCLWCVLHFHSPQNAMYVILMSTNLSAFERMVWEYLLKLNLWSIFNNIIL